jgi:hypothetical protein
MPKGKAFRLKVEIGVMNNLIGDLGLLIASPVRAKLSGVDL